MRMNLLSGLQLHLTTRHNGHSQRDASQRIAPG
jgi:hypothetical protein